MTWPHEARGLRGSSIQPLPSDVEMWWRVILMVLDAIVFRPCAGLMRKETDRTSSRSQGIQSPWSPWTLRVEPT